MAEYSPLTKGTSRTTPYISTDAIAAVTKNTATVMPMIRPALPADSIFAMAEQMEQNTMGTTTQNIRLINTVPNGSSTVAPARTVSPAPSFTTGKIAPTTQPAPMPKSISSRKP